MGLKLFSQRVSFYIQNSIKWHGGAWRGWNKKYGFQEAPAWYSEEQGAMHKTKCEHQGQCYSSWGMWGNIRAYIAYYKAVVPNLLIKWLICYSLVNFGDPRSPHAMLHERRWHHTCSILYDAWPVVHQWPLRYVMWTLNVVLSHISMKYSHLYNLHNYIKIR